uniref:SPOR domain-containing protein n=1 Tax=Halomonas sp. TaxID=1486246 RepID=UPI0026132FD7|nr:SPOR domain-containing protein [Halomonas sp.]
MATRKTTPPRKRGATSSKKRKSTPTSGRGGLPWWLWAGAGIAAGYLLAHYQNGTAPWQDQGSPVAAVLPKPSGSQQGGSEAKGGGSDEPPMPTFEFYTLLPESEVIAPDADMPVSTAKRPEAARKPEQESESEGGISGDDPIAAVIAAANAKQESAQQTASKPAASSTTASANRRYMLQAASFRDIADANQLASRLKDFGLLAKISDVEAAGGATWHRVQVGPYSDRQELARAQDLMSTQGIEPLLIQLQN